MVHILNELKKNNMLTVKILLLSKKKKTLNGLKNTDKSLI